MIVHYHSLRSICLLLRPNRKVEWWWDGNPHLCIFLVLHSGTKLCSLLRNAVLILVYYFISRHRSSGFHLALPNIIALIPQIRKLIWGYYKFLSVSFLIWNSGTQAITTGWISGFIGFIVRQTWTKTLLILLPSRAHTLTGRLQWHFGSLGISVSSESVSGRSWKVNLFPFPQCTITLVKDNKSLWGILGDRLTVWIFGSVFYGASTRGPGLPFIQGVLTL